jgi:hypothetical protein
MKFVMKLPIVFLLFIMSCSSSTIKKKDITFAGYLKTLDIISLPFEHACTGPNISQYSIHFDSAGFKKYKDRNCARPLGVLFNDKSGIVIVDLSLADYCIDPCLSSFDKTGHKIDSLNLYGDAYQDTASAIMPYFRIDKNKRIVIIDTLKKWNVDTPSKILSNKIDSTIYYISKNGKFIKEKPKKL